MPSTYSVSEAQAQLPTLLKRAENELIVITRRPGTAEWRETLRPHFLSFDSHGGRGVQGGFFFAVQNIVPVPKTLLSTTPLPPPAGLSTTPPPQRRSLRLGLVDLVGFGVDIPEWNGF
jgi:hypothetical protein